MVSKCSLLYLFQLLVKVLNSETLKQNLVFIAEQLAQRVRCRMEPRWRWPSLLRAPHSRAQPEEAFAASDY